MDSPDDLLATRAIHGDVRARSGALVAPIVQATTFAADSDEGFLRAATSSFTDDFYIRYGNPNHTQVAEVIASLEGAERAIVTASGMGAISTLAFGILGQGDHVVLQRSSYPGVTSLAATLLARFGVRSKLVPHADESSLAEALEPETRLVLLETPSNPLLEIVDLRRLSAIAHDNGSLVAVDNTVATPINQRPLELGADLVWHSATKYLGGHSDVSAGIIAGRSDLVEQIWRTHLLIGSVLGPFDAWLLLRGLRTLDVRMRRHNENALALASTLDAHPDIRDVLYPGLPDHPGHDLAASQMSGYGGLLSFVASGGPQRAERLLDSLRLTERAASLGSVHSIANRPAAMWSQSKRSDGSVDADIDDSLIRVSVGIEAAEDLIKDFERALTETRNASD